MVPVPTPETAHFWDGTRVGELRVQRCRACRHAYLPPQPWCPKCAAADIDVEVATGRGRLLSSVVSHLAAPGCEPPFIIAIVELDEGPQLLTNIVGIAPELGRVPPDLAVEVVFEQLGDLALPLFRPRDASPESRRNKMSSRVRSDPLMRIAGNGGRGINACVARVRAGSLRSPASDRLRCRRI